VLASAGVLLAVAAPTMTAGALDALRNDLADIGRLQPTEALVRALDQAAWIAGPFALAALVAGSLSVLLQTGFLVNLATLRPDLSRLDPRRGLRRVCGADTLLEVGKSSLKLAAIGFAGWHVVTRAWPFVSVAMLWEPARLMAVTRDQIVQLLIAMLSVQAVLAGADVVRARLKHTSALRMSRQELRDELKESEGDPRIKARLRQLRQQRARSRMMAAVPKAAVVVTNPTHFAVALAYEKGHAAPRVVAKGADSLAARIRAVAEQARVPIVANPPLARALYRVELDTNIPPEHYQVVAEVIAYVWRLRTRARTARL
jgi:flagellar biosynthetic protein FlhB